MAQIRTACLLAAACLAATRIPLATAAEKPSGSIVGVAGPLDLPVPNRDFIAVAAGVNLLGLKADGSVMAVQGNAYVETDVPSPNTGFIAVATGASTVCVWGCIDVDYSLGLRADGSIVRWYAYYLLDVPEPNADFIAIAAGHGHNLGLKANGSIVAWGRNESGQLDVPEPNADFIAIAAGYGYSLGLKANGSVVGWGQNSESQLNVPSPNADFIAIAAGGYEGGIDSFSWNYYSLGLKADGSIVAWGCCHGLGGCENVCCDDYGVCHVPQPNTGFVAISAGQASAFGLKADGSMVAWGHYTEVPQPNSDFIAIASGTNSALGIRQIGACCDLLAETCEDDVGKSQCSGAQQLWINGAACVDVVCEPTTGACCNIRLGTCVVTLQEECQGENVVWTKGSACSEQTCPDPFVPTVSQWGLVILTLLLMITAKIAFGGFQPLKIDS